MRAALAAASCICIPDSFKHTAICIAWFDSQPARARRRSSRTRQAALARGAWRDGHGVLTKESRWVVSTVNSGTSRAFLCIAWCVRYTLQVMDTI